eukprot:458452_1
MSFIWHLTPPKAIKLCSGYFRIVINQSNVDVPESIYKICNQFYEETIPHFTTSPVFTSFGLKWLFKLHVRVLEIILISPRCNFNINLSISLLNSTKSTAFNCVQFKDGRSRLKLPFDVRYPQFIIDIDIIRFQHIYKSLASYTQSVKNIGKTSQSLTNQYIWNISPQQIIHYQDRLHKKQTICISPAFTMHGFRWYLYIEEQNNLYIACHSIPLNTRVYILYDIYCKENDNYKVSDVICFEVHGPNHGRTNFLYDLNAKKIFTQKIDYANFKTLHISLTLIEIYSLYMPISYEYPCAEIPIESFTWITSENKYEKQYYLVSGYFRHISNQLIVANVINLSLNYLNYFQNVAIRLYNTQTYTYTPQTVSPTFMLAGFKWYLSLRVDKWQNQLCIGLHLAAQHPTVVELTTRFSIKCCELNHPPNDSVRNMLWYPDQRKKKIKFIPETLETLNRLTFNVNIVLLGVISSQRPENKSKSITNDYKSLLNPSMAEMTYKYSYKLEKTVVDKILNNQHHHVFFQILAFQCCLKVINKILWVEISEYSKDITYGIKWRVVVNELNVEKIWYANYK